MDPKAWLHVEKMLGITQYLSKMLVHCFKFRVYLESAYSTKTENLLLKVL